MYDILFNIIVTIYVLITIFFVQCSENLYFFIMQYIYYLCIFHIIEIGYIITTLTEYLYNTSYIHITI